MQFPTDDDSEWTALPRYFAGELAEPDAIRLQQWIDADTGRAAAVAELRTVWSAVGRPIHAWDAGAALQRIKQTKEQPRDITLDDGLPLQDPAASADVFRGRPWWKSTGVAAALLVSALGGWWVSTFRAAPADTPSEPLMTELVTRRGQRADLLLPDGSRVTLGVGSRLRYPTRYAGSARELYLDGEAYFQVAHDATKPFRVHTARGVAEDLGTAFGIRAYGAGKVEVAVAEGAVVLRNGSQGATVGDTVVLGQADLGVIDSKGRLTRTANVDVESYLAWRRGKLVFHSDSLQVVLHRISQWYDIDLELADSALATRPFTASFDNESVDRVLDVLALTLRLRYERRGSLRLVSSR